MKKQKKSHKIKSDKVSREEYAENLKLELHEIFGFINKLPNFDKNQYQYLISDVDIFEKERLLTIDQVYIYIDKLKSIIKYSSKAVTEEQYCNIMRYYNTNT